MYVCMQVSFGCVKISAICPIQLLEHVSSLLRWQHKNKEFKLPWNEKGLPILAAESPTHSVQTMPEPLTNEEEHDWTLAHQRLWKLCRACEIQGMPLVVDAEYMSLQPAIDTIVYAAMLEFNKGCPPLVYGTFQAYLKDTKPRLSLALKGASEHGISLGVKLVRGAYITRETAVAASYNVPSPIHPNIQETHRCYDECAAIMLEEVANGKGSLLVGTHNVNSGRYIYILLQGWFLSGEQSEAALICTKAD
jgi:proline dehydrogenase